MTGTCDRARARFDLFVNGYGHNQPPEVIAQAWSEVLESLKRDPWVNKVDADAAAVLVGRFPWCFAEAGRLVLAGQASAEQWVKVAGVVPQEWTAGPLALAAAGWRRAGQGRRAVQTGSMALSALQLDSRVGEPDVGEWEQVAHVLVWFAVEGYTAGQCLDALDLFPSQEGGKC